MKPWTTLLLGALLVGCFDDGSDEPPYPPLDARALVGCWEYVKPASYCGVYCFGKSGEFFESGSFTEPPTAFAEDSGAYWITQNRLNIDAKFRTTTGNYGLNNDGLNLTIIRDTLQPIDPIGGSLFARVHPDSFPCGLKPWTLFQKPAGWDSLIQPY